MIHLLKCVPGVLHRSGLGALVWQPWEAQAAAEAVDPEDGLNTP